MNKLEIKIMEQECDEVGYVFGNNIPMVITKNLLRELREFSDFSPNQIIFLAHSQLLEERKSSNIDYLQVFEVCQGTRKITFWAISNLVKDEKPNKDSYLCWLLPSDY